jgi:stage II sporulation protein D
MAFDTTQEVLLHIGILESPCITVQFDTMFRVQGSGSSLTGQAVARPEGDGLVLTSESGVVVHARDLVLEPMEPLAASFQLYDVVIGKQFHWERTEHQRFRGALHLMRVEGTVLAINTLGVEDYLTSVISSEMSAEGPLEFLKAHAITSRSWLLAQIQQSRELKAGLRSRPPSVHHEAGRLIRWYDREDHRLFDVCADDHCQRYQGVTKAFTPAVAEAVNATRGQVLLYEGRICDARFSKSCGGVSELYENAWDQDHHPYLVPIRDAEDVVVPDLTTDTAAERWIRSTPSAFCLVRDPGLFERILPQVDQETTDPYRWRVDIGQDELAARLKEKLGIDFGMIQGLVPVRRGPSGRIVELRITGSRTSLTVGKELEIRRVLSASHLRSSAFVVDMMGTTGGVPDRFALTGAGWGHGVGLCQIGAGVMGARGFTAEQILLHYFHGASLKALYH